MKRLFILLLLVFSGSLAFSMDLNNINAEPNSQKILTANVVFNWLDINQVERDAVIEQYQKELFTDDIVYKYKRKVFREENKNFLKDSDYKRHYMLASNNVKETDKENLCGFFRKKLLISYAVQYKNDLKTVYYYDTLGHLIYIDKFSENYPDFPYMSKQYRANGTLVSAIYFIDEDLQYMYNSDQSFKGVWYKEKMYDRKAKQILTRNNW